MKKIIFFSFVGLVLGVNVFAKENKAKIPYNTGGLTKIMCTIEADSLGLNDTLIYYIDDKNKKILYDNAKEYMFYDIDNYNHIKKNKMQFNKYFIEIGYLEKTNYFYEHRFILNRMNGNFLDFSTALNNADSNIQYSVGNCSKVKQ